MIRHVLLFKFREGIPNWIRADALERPQGLGEQCPTVSSWSVGANFASSRSAYDMAEVADFTDEQALQDYKDHPAHRELAEYLGTISTWALVDYELTPTPADPETMSGHLMDAVRQAKEGSDPRET